MKLRQRIENQSIMKILGITFLLIFLIIVLWVKILGASNVVLNVEKNGYCKQYGEDWRNIKGSNICRNKYHLSQGIEDIDFTEQEFRDYCPKNKIISLKFFSDCFKQSGGI